MNKTISIIVVIVLLLSLGVFTIPAGTSVETEDNIYVMSSPTPTKPGQQTCPEGNGWIKDDNPPYACEYWFEASPGCQIAAYCYKAGTDCSGPIYLDPPAESPYHFVLSPCPHDLSHVSHLEVCPTPTPTSVPTATPTEIPTSTPTEMPTDLPTVTPTPNIIVPPTGGNGNTSLFYEKLVVAFVLLVVGAVLFNRFRPCRKKRKN